MIPGNVSASSRRGHQKLWELERRRPGEAQKTEEPELVREAAGRRQGGKGLGLRRV